MIEIIKNHPKEGRKREKREQKMEGTTRKQIARLKVKYWRKRVYHTNINRKKVGLSKLISDGVYSIARNILEKKGHFIMIKYSIPQDNICSCT